MIVPSPLTFLFSPASLWHKVAAAEEIDREQVLLWESEQ